MTVHKPNLRSNFFPYAEFQILRSPLSADTLLFPSPFCSKIALANIHFFLFSLKYLKKQLAFLKSRHRCLYRAFLNFPAEVRSTIIIPSVYLRRDITGRWTSQPVSSREAGSVCGLVFARGVRMRSDRTGDGPPVRPIRTQ